MKKRETVRMVLLDENERTLLIKIENKDVADPNKPLRRPFWVTPGGKIEKGESYIEALKRELQEETGITLANIGPKIWYGEVILDWKGELTTLIENFYLVRVNSAQIDLTGMTGEEREVYRDNRWWLPGEIKRSNETFIPRDLGTLLETLKVSQLPSTPVRIDLSTPE